MSLPQLLFAHHLRTTRPFILRLRSCIHQYPYLHTSNRFSGSRARNISSDHGLLNLYMVALAYVKQELRQSWRVTWLIEPGSLRAAVKKANRWQQLDKEGESMPQIIPFDCLVRTAFGGRCFERLRKIPRKIPCGSEFMRSGSRKWISCITYPFCLEICVLKNCAILTPTVWNSC